jgi:hypothetical protein
MKRALEMEKRAAVMRILRTRAVLMKKRAAVKRTTRTVMLEIIMSWICLYAMKVYW